MESVAATTFGVSSLPPPLLRTVNTQGFLTDSELSELYQRVKPIVWILKITGYSKGHKLVTYGSGFSVNNDGILLTCAHILSNLSNLNIEARLLDKDNFNTTVILFQRPSWDVALLKVSEINGCNFGQLAPDGALFEGETLMHIGSPHEFVGSFLSGRVGYQCVEGATLPTDGRTCYTYNSTALAVTPQYRVMGHVWNTGVFEKFQGKKFVYEKNLHPLVPIIQCAGFICGEGCSGGPVLNTRGEIVGMLVGQSDGYEIALHVTLLREFLKIALEHSSSEVDLKGKGHAYGGPEVFKIDRSSEDISKSASYSA